MTRLRISAYAVAVPSPLAALLVVAVIVGAAWAMIVPPWQSPDAFTHYSYVESLASRGAAPGRPGYPESSSNTAAAIRAAGSKRVQWSALAVRPSWTAAAARTYRIASARLSRSDGGGTTASENFPPLYYFYGAIGYLTAIGGDALDRVNTVQLWGIPLLMATVTGAWLLAGEVFGRRRILQLLTAAVAGLEPMVAFISTSVNPDALLIVLWTFVLWLGVRVIRRGAPAREVTILGGLTAAAILTKETSYALVPAVLLAALLGWRRRADREPALASIRRYLPALLALIVPVLVWVLFARRTGRPVLSVSPPTSAFSRAPGSFIRGFLDYLWQFYLPRLPGQAVFHVPTLSTLPWPRVLPGLPVWNVWIREGWGAFGWLDVYMSGWVYAMVGAITGAVAIAGAAIVARFRDRLRLSMIGFFALVLISLLAVVHVVEYETLTGKLGPNTQGRYALPVVALFGLGVALIISRLPIRFRLPAAGLILAGLLGLQVLALGSVGAAYYT